MIYRYLNVTLVIFLQNLVLSHSKSYKYSKGVKGYFMVGTLFWISPTNLDFTSKVPQIICIYNIYS